MQAIILAAGMGKRLKELTKDNTKCMVKVNGVALIDRVLHQLDLYQLSRIVIVIGYEGQKLKDFISSFTLKTPVCYVENPIYYKTNNIYSLMLARDYLLQEDTLLLESDIIFEDAVIRKLLEDPRDTLALVDKYESWMSGTCIKIGPDDSIEDFIPGKKFVFSDIPEYYKTVNIYKFSQNFSKNYYVPFLDAYSKALGNNEYYEQVLRVIAMLDEPVIKAKKLNGELWYEIDDIQDLDIANSLFAESEEERVEAISARYGGYWRYPRLLDFCYLVNPYYPPEKLIDEMKANFEVLLTQYPSGMGVNSLLAAKNFGVHKEHVAIGNGAAELIKCLMPHLQGKLGMVRPTFEEYPNRYEKELCEVYVPENPDFSYTAGDLIDFFEHRDIKNLILINPDNPTGNYLPKSDLMLLAEWCEAKGIRFILDESFADFADEEHNTLIDEELLRPYPNEVVVKSISKSYGVPGIRLGVAFSMDRELITELKKETAIWNINSFAEFYMQIMEKYSKEYKIALEKLKGVRREMVDELKAIGGLRVIPSQANYVMVEIVNGMTAKELTKGLLLQYNLFIKDLSGKISQDRGQYVRLAVRTKEENRKLMEALRDYLNKGLGEE